MKRSGSGAVVALFLGLWAIGAAAPARADQIRHPSGFTFKLPELGESWEQEPRDSLYIVSVGGDADPELQIFVFPPKDVTVVEHHRERPLTIQEIKEDLVSEAKQGGVRPGDEKLKTMEVLDSKAEHVADAEVLIGSAKLNGSKACWAIVHRGDRYLILIGVPRSGIYERGMSSFRAVVHGLRPVAKGAVSRDVLPNLPAVVGVRDVSATSTYRDRKDRYAAWRTLVYTEVENGGMDVPRTAWCEGKRDEGVGETVTIRLAAPTRLDQIRIAAGVWLTEKLFAENNRITALDVTLDGKTTRVTPPATRAWASVDVGRPVSTIAIKIAGVKQGKMNDSCLSAVDLIQGGKELVVVRGVDGAAAAALPGALARLEAQLGGAPPPRSLEALLDFPLSVHASDSFFAGGGPAVTLRNWKALVAACRAQAKAAAAGGFAFKGCPPPVAVDAKDDWPGRILSPAPGVIEVTFPSHREVLDVWRLRWRHGAWKLQAIDYTGT